MRSLRLASRWLGRRYTGRARRRLLWGYALCSCYFDDDIVVGVDVDLRCDAQRLTRQAFRIEIGKFHECLGGGQGVRSPAADEQLFGRPHDEQRFQTAQRSVLPPIFRQLDGRAGEVVFELVELPFELLEQGDPVCGRPCKARDDLPPGDSSDFACTMLHHVLVERHLPVARHRQPPVPTNRDDRRRPYPFSHLPIIPGEPWSGCTPWPHAL